MGGSLVNNWPGMIAAAVTTRVPPPAFAPLDGDVTPPTNVSWAGAETLEEVGVGKLFTTWTGVPGLAEERILAESQKGLSSSSTMEKEDLPPQVLFLDRL